MKIMKLFTVSLIIFFTIISNMLSEEHLYPMRENLRWGFINQNGEWVIEPEYLNVAPFREGFAAVSFDDMHWKIIDKKGKQFLDRTFNANWAMYNEAGEKIPHGDAPYFSEGLLPVYHEGKMAYYNTDGKIEFTVDTRSAFHFYNGLALIEKDDKFGYIDKSGKIVIKPQFNEAEHFHEGRAAFREYVKEKDKYLWGYIDKSGEKVIKPQFIEAGNFSNGLAMIQTESQKRKTGYYGLIGFIDKSGKMAIEPQFKPFGNHERFSEGLSGQETETSENFGFVNKSGNYVIKPVYEEVQPFSEGLALVTVEDEDYNETYKFINKSGNTVLETNFMQKAVEIWPFRNGLSKIAVSVHGGGGLSATGSGFEKYTHDSYLAYMNKGGEIVARQSDDEIAFIIRKSDSVDKAKAAEEKRKQKMANKKEQELLEDCPDNIVYGNKSYRNWLEISVKGKTRRIYFDDAVIEKYSNKEFTLFIPPFGPSEENRIRALKNTNAGIFSSLFRSLMNDLSNINLDFQIGDAFDDFEYSSSRLRFLDCLTKIRNEHTESLFDEFETENKADVKFFEENGSQKAELNFASILKKDSNDYIKGYFITDNIETKNRDEKISKKAQSLIVDKEKYYNSDIYLYPKSGIIKLGNPANFQNHNTIEMPENGSKLSAVKIGTEKLQINEIKLLNDNEIFINKYKVDISDRLSGSDNSIFIEPKNEIPDDLSQFELTEENLESQVYCPDYTVIDYEPVIIKSISQSELPPPDPKSNSLTMEDLPSMNFNFNELREVKGVYDENMFEIISPEKSNSGMWSLVLKKYNSQLGRALLTYQRIKDRMSDEEYNHLAEFAVKASELMEKDKLTEKEKEEAYKWLEKIINKLGLNYEKKANFRKTLWEAGKEVNRRYSKNAMRSFVYIEGKYLPNKDEAEKILPKIQDVFKTYQDYKSDNDKSKFIEKIKEIADSEGFEIDLNEKYIQRIMRALETKFEEKYGEGKVETAFAMIEYKEEKGSSPIITIDKSSGLPISKNSRFGAGQRDIPATDLKIDYSGGTIKLTANNSKIGEDIYIIENSKPVIDMQQFELMLPFMPLGPGYEAQFGLFDVEPVSTFSYSTDKGNSTDFKLKPVFGKAIVKYIGNSTIEKAGKKYSTYEIKIIYDGNVESVTGIKNYERYLQYDSNTGLGYLNYYVSKEYPHEIIKVEQKNGSLYPEFRFKE